MWKISPFPLLKEATSPLKDVAEVKDTFAREDSYALLNGKPSVTLAVFKQSGANTVVVADKVKTELARIQQELPYNLSVYYSAVLEAGPVRLRPILMTALTTIFALIPLSLALGESSEAQASMATVVIGGLTFSTFLTLVIVPVVYTLFDDLGRRRAAGEKARTGVSTGAASGV